MRICDLIGKEYRKGTIYIISCDALNMIKIGFTEQSCPKRRLRQMQSGCPLKLRLVKTIPGTWGMEQEMHGDLKKHRCRGEWFYGTPEVMEFINRLDKGD